MLVAGARAGGRGWFDSRRDYFIRQALGDFMTIAIGFQELYASCLECCLQQSDGGASWKNLEVGETWGRMHRRLAEMVGTERDAGPLWQLKDLCHRIWPQQQRDLHSHGVLVDWLIGSLFHEAMKLKENLYLLGTYGPAAAALGGGAGTGVGRDDRPPRSRMAGLDALIERTVAGQLERMGFLFGQVNYLLRLMLPDLAANPLVIRLLAEREQEVTDLWGESLEELFADVLGGRSADGFCLAGASYLHGHWRRQALTMYQRALALAPGCDEAIVRIAHIEAILRVTPGECTV